MVKAHILIELSSGSKYKYVRDIVNDSNGNNEEYYEYEGSGYQEVGLKRIHGAKNTGLNADETYDFQVNIDGGGITSYNIIPKMESCGFISYGQIIKLMNEVMDGDGATWIITYEGDMRCTSDSEAAASSIALTAGAVNDLFSSLDLWTGSFAVAVAGDNFNDQIVAGEVKKDFTDLTTAYSALLNFNDLLPFPESGGATTILKRKNLTDDLNDSTYQYLQIAAGEIVAISVIEIKTSR